MLQFCWGEEQYHSFLEVIPSTLGKKTDKLKLYCLETIKRNEVESLQDYEHLLLT